MSNGTPTFLLDKLRLELAAPPAPGAHVNLIANPDGTGGTWGWGTPNLSPDYAPLTKFDRTLIETVAPSAGRSAIRCTQPGVPFTGSSSGYTSDSNLVSAMFKVTAGQQLRTWVTPLVAESQTSSSGAWTAGQIYGFVYFYDAAEQRVGNIGQLVPNGVASPTSVSTVVTVPAGAYQARFSFGSAGADGYARYAQRFTITDLAAVCEPTDPGAGAALTPRTWTDVLTSASSVDIDRDALGVSTIKAIVRDSLLDPLTSPLLAPGTAARVRCLTPAGVWEPLMTGLLGDPAADYDQRRLEDPDPAKSRKGTVIEVSVTDPLTVAANTRSPLSYPLAGIPYLLGEMSTPWDVNGKTDRSVRVSGISYSENASVADQLVISRDTETTTSPDQIAYVWITRAGVIKARTTATMAGTVATLTRDHYSAAPASYALDRVINQVRVQVQSYVSIVGGTPALPSFTFEGIDTEFGPYRNGASVAANGAREATLTIAATGPVLSLKLKAQVAAAKLLAANGTPARHVDSITVPIRSAADLIATRALIDLYDQITVITPALTQTARVTSISHRITPKRWLMTLGFDVPGSVPAPIGTPSASAVAGGTDAIPMQLANTWVAFGTPYQPPVYRRDGNTVSLSGLIKSGTAVITTLPAGFTPANREVFVTLANEQIGRVDVDPSGQVTLAKGSNAYVSLSGITFRAAGDS